MAVVVVMACCVCSWRGGIWCYLGRKTMQVRIRLKTATRANVPIRDLQ